MSKYSTKGLNALSKEIRVDALELGFGNSDVPLRTALIHSEMSEAFEAFRMDKFCEIKDKEFELNWLERLKKEMEEKPELKLRYQEYFKHHIKDTFEDEIADTIIRLLDLCAEMDIDIEYHIEQKLYFNKTRGHKFGGKKF